jgi:hypothetical protein
MNVKGTTNVTSRSHILIYITYKVTFVEDNEVSLGNT